VKGLGTPSARGEAVLRLKPLGLKAGDVVRYKVRVADNRPAPRGPNVAWSDGRRLTIVEQAEPLRARRAEAGRKAIQEELDALKKAAAENRQATELLRYAADAAQRGNGTFDGDRVRELARREADARDLVDGLNRLARRLDDEPAYRPLARPARQVADVEAEAARAALDQARQDDDPARRFADLRLADARLGAVALRLEDLQRDLDALAGRDAQLRRLQSLADRQGEVADRAVGDEQHPDRAGLDRLAADQNAVRNELDALLKASPELRAEVLAAEADRAEALARRARALADRQRGEARRATDLTEKAATLRRLAEEQRAIEEDARRLALDVDGPLAEAGRGRLNVEPIRRAAEPLARGELAAGRDRLAAAEAELQRLARNLDEAPGDLKALAGRLARRQDQLAFDLAPALGDDRDKPGLPAAGRAALKARLAPLAERQKAVAALAGALRDAGAADDGPAKPPFPREAAEKAAAASARAAEALDAADNPREAEARALEVRTALQRLANALPDAWRHAAVAGPRPRDPDLGIDPGHAARARALAGRERKLREALGAVLADRAGPQQALRRESQAVGRDLAALRDRVGDLSPRAPGPAREAASLLGEQAPKAMDEAAGRLARGEPDPARDAQRRAAELAERGAQRVDDLIAALRAGSEPGSGSESKHRALADAREAVSRAARALDRAHPPAPDPGSDPGAMGDARRATREAADRLQSAAESDRSRDPDDGEAEPGSEPGAPDRSLAQSREPQGRRAGVAVPEALDQIQDLVRRTTGRRWGELPGHLRSELLQMSQGRYRDDYARLIQLYYREIASGAPRAGGDKPGGAP
jgi:hypothetical protein